MSPLRRRQSPWSTGTGTAPRSRTCSATASSALLSGTSPVVIPRVNTAWMWGALLAASMAAWLHQLTAATAGLAVLAGHGVRGGKAMIATLRWRLIAVPAACRHAGQLILRLPPGRSLLAEILARLRALPALP